MKKVFIIAILFFALSLTTCSLLADVFNEVPAVPTSFRVFANSPTEIHINWHLSRSASEYIIYRSENAGGPYTEIAVIKDSHRHYYHDGIGANPLRANRRYYYKIAARNTHGTSPLSSYISCTTPTSVYHAVTNPTGDYPFWAMDMFHNANYKTWARFQLEGEHCIVYQEIPGYYPRSPTINLDIAKTIAAEFDEKIYPRVVAAFGHPWDDDDEEEHHGKVVLLLLDIQDAYTHRGSGPNVAGYFHSSDLFMGLHSNGKDMIYIDTYPGFTSIATETGKKKLYDTMAHEFQHLINYSQHWANHQRAMEVWIDEGLAESATYVYSGNYQTDRINYYRNDPLKSIRQGNTFFVWNDHHNDIVAEYATVYMFFQWLRIQAGSSDIYGEIIHSAYHDYHSIVDAVKNYPSFWEQITGTTPEAQWESLLMHWFAANMLNEASGIHGYRGITAFANLNAKTLATSSDRLRLAPGEGVYTVVNTPITVRPANSGVNIQYAEINKTTGEVKTAMPFSQGSYLLTFNKNPRSTGSSGGLEPGYVVSMQGPRSLLEPEDTLPPGYIIPEYWEWDAAAYYRDRFRDQPLAQTYR